MKPLLSFLVVLLCSVSLVEAQSRSNIEIQERLRSSEANASVNFDAGSKVTTLKGVADNFSDADTKRSGAKAMNFAIGAIYAGDKIEKSVDPITLSFWIMSGGKPRFAESQALSATHQGQTTDLGSGRHTFRKDGMEYINFSLTRDQVSKLAAAESWVLGSRQFTPTASQKNLVRAVLSATDLN